MGVLMARNSRPERQGEPERQLFFQAEDGIRDYKVTGVQTCALPILTMPAIVEDLEGLELVGEGADAVLLGGADEGFETNRVFSYFNLARAFAELQDGAELYCLHKNRWWQTSRGALL